MDTYECIDCLGKVEYCVSKLPPEPERCSECDQIKNFIVSSCPVRRTTIFKCKDCGRKYYGEETMYDTEARPRVELNSYTGRKKNEI